MVKLIATNTVISKGFNGAPAIQVSESGNAARFRVSYRVYDKQAEGNYRYINLTVKAFGTLIKKLSDLKLGAGSTVNLIGRLDEETWTDKKTGETKKAFAVILDEIEYAAGVKTQENTGINVERPSDPESGHGSSEGSKPNFEGYEPFAPSYFDD